MKVKTITLAGSILAAIATTSTNAEIIGFFPSGDSKVTIKIKDNEVEIINGDNLEKKIEFDTGKILNIEISDYNFDGNLDFSIWHVDEGMGTYLTYRVFIFNPKSKKLIEASPSCGEEFINLNQNRKTKSLSSTYFKNNIPKFAIQSYKENNYSPAIQNLVKTLPLLIICIVFPSISLADSCQSAKEPISTNLYKNNEYRNFICGKEKCTPEIFSERISIEAIDLGKNLKGCFATPIKKAENFYTGLYLIQGNEANQQFIFFGSYLCKTKSIKNGHYMLTGEERIDSENKERYTFKWNGKNYVSTSTSPSHSPGDLNCQ